MLILNINTFFLKKKKINNMTSCILLNPAASADLSKSKLLNDEFRYCMIWLHYWTEGL
jgi:hypothetical protein